MCPPNRGNLSPIGLIGVAGAVATCHKAFRMACAGAGGSACARRGRSARSDIATNDEIQPKSVNAVVSLEVSTVENEWRGHGERSG
jgi:hypothetical protein